MEDVKVKIEFNDGGLRENLDRINKASMSASAAARVWSMYPKILVMSGLSMDPDVYPSYQEMDNNTRAIMRRDYPILNAKSAKRLTRKFTWIIWKARIKGWLKSLW